MLFRSDFKVSIAKSFRSEEKIRQQVFADGSRDVLKIDNIETKNTNLIPDDLFLFCTQASLADPLFVFLKKFPGKHIGGSLENYNPVYFEVNTGSNTISIRKRLNVFEVVDDAMKSFNIIDLQLVVEPDNRSVELFWVNSKT